MATSRSARCFLARSIFTRTPLNMGDGIGEFRSDSCRLPRLNRPAVDPNIMRPDDPVASTRRSQPIALVARARLVASGWLAVTIFRSRAGAKSHAGADQVCRGLTTHQAIIEAKPLIEQGAVGEINSKRPIFVAAARRKPAGECRWRRPPGPGIQITDSTPRPSLQAGARANRGSSASAPTPGTKSTAAQGQGSRPTRRDGGRPFEGQLPGSCRSLGRTRQARVSPRSQAGALVLLDLADRLDLHRRRVEDNPILRDIDLTDAGGRQSAGRRVWARSRTALRP
jgi:hypothetical protein